MIPLLAALGALIVGPLVLLRPFVLFPALLTISAVFDAKVPLGPVTMHPSNILTVALAVSVLFHRVRNRDLAIGRVQVHAAVIGFWIVLAGAATFSGGTIRRVLALALMYLAFEATYQGIRSRADYTRLRDWIALSGVLAAVRGWAGRGIDHNTFRAAGVFGNPNGLGMFLAGCIPITFSILLTTRDRRRRFFGGLALVISFYGIWISGSRGALLGALAGCVLVSSRHIRHTLIVGGVLAFLIGSLSVLEESDFQLFRMPQALQDAPIVIENSKIWLAVNGFQEVSYSGPPWIEPGVLDRFPQTFGARLTIWNQAVYAGLSAPLFGLGTGNSMFSALPFDSKTFGNCFNIYLASFVEGGLPGLLLHLLWLRLLFVAFLRVLRRPDPGVLGAGAAGSTLALMTHGLVEDTYFAIYPNWLIGIVFASLIRLGDLPIEPAAGPATPGPSAAFPAAGSAADRRS